MFSFLKKLSSRKSTEVEVVCVRRHPLVSAGTYRKRLTSAGNVFAFLQMNSMR